MYAGCAKGGQIAVPIMFQLAPVDKVYHQPLHQQMIIVEEPFVESINSIRDNLKQFPKITIFSWEKEKHLTVIYTMRIF